MFAMRNGIITETLRRAGAPFSIIFGLNLPQLVEIADEFGPDRSLAEDLWANVTTRESRLLAPMLMPRDTFTIGDACAWIEGVETDEVADILCHRLLRHLPYALELVDKYKDDADKQRRYTALRLMCNLAPAHRQLANAIGSAELDKGEDALRPLALRLLEY